jgi:hypothetical protein
MISFRRLNRAVSQQKLDQFQIAAVFATELRTGPAQAVGAELLDPNLLCRLLDDRPNRPTALLESGRSRRPSSILAAIIQAVVFLIILVLDDIVSMLGFAAKHEKKQIDELLEQRVKEVLT